MLKYKLSGFSLQIGWVAVFFLNAANHHTNLGTRGFTNGPINRDTLSDVGDQFGGDHFQFVAAHRLHGTVVHGQRVVETDLVLVQAQLLAAFGGFTQLFRQTGDKKGSWNRSLPQSYNTP